MSIPGIIDEAPIDNIPGIMDEWVVDNSQDIIDRECIHNIQKFIDGKAREPVYNPYLLMGHASIMARKLSMGRNHG